MEQNTKAELYTRYPLSGLFIYNGVTFLHFLLGGVGLILGYSFSWIGYPLGLLYLAFAFLQMYVIMPLLVCPNCVYYELENALCPSGLNVLSKRVAKQGDRKNFGKRAQGLFCHNNLYLTSLLGPILLMIPALILNFSFALLLTFLTVVGLLLFRFFVIFTRVACVHCHAKYECPNAEATGVRDM